MLNIFKKIIKPDSVRILLDALDKEKRLFLVYNTKSSFESAFNLVVKHLEQLIYSNANEMISEAKKHISFKEYILNVICNIAVELLLSGKFHVPFGVGILDENGPGMDLLEIIRITNDELVQCNFLTDTERKEFDLELSASIRMTG